MAFAAGASAQQLLTTGDTGTQGAGGNLIETAYTWTRGHASARTSDEVGKITGRERALEVTYTYGLTETIDAYASTSHTRGNERVVVDGERESDHASGFGNTAIGAKWRFFDNEESGTSLSINPEITLPVSKSRENDGLGTGRTSGSLTLALTQTLPFGAVNFNVGVGRERYRDNDENPNERVQSFSVAPVWEVSERFKVAFDTGIERVRSRGKTERSKFAEITAVYAPVEDVELSIAYTYTRARATDKADPQDKIHEKGRDRAVAIGVAWAF
jgi:hypothetical protein